MDIKELQNMLTMHLYMSDSLSCGVLAYTIPEREILIFNAEAKRLFNYNDAEEKSIGEIMQERIISEDSKRVSKVVLKLKNPGDNCEYKYHIFMVTFCCHNECYLFLKVLLQYRLPSL